MNPHTIDGKIHEEGQRIMDRDPQERNQTELTELLRDALGVCLERRLADCEDDLRSNIERLYDQELLHMLETGQWLKDKRPFPELTAELSLQITINLRSRLDRLLERDEDERLRQGMVNSLSIATEEGLISSLLLRDPLNELRRRDRESWTCFLMVHHMGYTREETSRHMGLSMQNVRTRIKRAGTFLKEALS